MEQRNSVMGVKAPSFQVKIESNSNTVYGPQLIRQLTYEVTLDLIRRVKRENEGKG